MEFLYVPIRRTNTTVSSCYCFMRLHFPKYLSYIEREYTPLLTPGR